jgi:curved DNA-binding protein CbpA
MIEAAYELLRVPRDADPQEVRQAYVRLVRRYPPEHFPEKFASLRRAYQQLNLEDDFLQEISSYVKEESAPLEIAGFLWGDRKNLRPEKSSSLSDLTMLLRATDTRQALDELLNKARTEASGQMEWMIS